MQKFNIDEDIDKHVGWNKGESHRLPPIPTLSRKEESEDHLPKPGELVETFQ